MRGARLPAAPGAPAALRALVERCTAPDAAARPSFAEVQGRLAQLQVGWGAP